MLTITWLLSTVVGAIKIDNNKKCKQISWNFDHHADTAVQCRAHCLMEHIQDFTKSHWKLPSSQCLCRIALVVTITNNFDCKHTNLTKHNFFLATYGTINCKSHENFIP
jgi:hypothetical protein